MCTLNKYSRIIFLLLCLQSVFELTLHGQESLWHSAYRYYQIELELEEDSLVANYLIEFSDDSLGNAEFKTADLDTFIHLMKTDFENLPDEKNQPMVYIHGMFGNQSTVLYYSKTEMRRLFDRVPECDIARFIVIRWPAQSPIYKIDKDNAHKIAPLLNPTFSKIVVALNDLNISPDIFAHSLGTEFFAAMHESMDNDSILLDQVILAAPDLDLNVFDDQQPLDGLENICNRVTVYHSHQDMTLGFSSKLNKKGRLGLDGPEMKNYQKDNLIFVDVSEIKDEEDFPLRLTGHSYYRSSPIITMDMSKTLIGKKAESITGRSVNSTFPNRYKIELKKVLNATSGSY